MSQHLQIQIMGHMLLGIRLQELVCSIFYGPSLYYCKWRVKPNSFNFLQGPTFTFLNLWHKNHFVYHEHKQSSINSFLYHTERATLWIRMKCQVKKALSEWLSKHSPIFYLHSDDCMESIHILRFRNPDTLYLLHLNRARC